jgi:hypothetical protein
MESKLLEALNEMSIEKFNSIDEAKKLYSDVEILDSWLRYEGIIGFTGSIITAVNILMGVER